jgi:hypothetical protein
MACMEGVFNRYSYLEYVYKDGVSTFWLLPVREQMLERKEARGFERRNQAKNSRNHVVKRKVVTIVTHSKIRRRLFWSTKSIITKTGDSR